MKNKCRLRIFLTILKVILFKSSTINKGYWSPIIYILDFNCSCLLPICVSWVIVLAYYYVTSLSYVATSGVQDESFTSFVTYQLDVPANTVGVHSNQTLSALNLMLSTGTFNRRLQNRTKWASWIPLLATVHLLCKTGVNIAISRQLGQNTYMPTKTKQNSIVNTICSVIQALINDYKARAYL